MASTRLSSSTPSSAPSSWSFSPSSLKLFVRFAPPENDRCFADDLSCQSSRSSSRSSPTLSPLFRQTPRPKFSTRWRCVRRPFLPFVRTQSDHISPGRYDRARESRPAHLLRPAFQHSRAHRPLPAPLACLASVCALLRSIQSSTDVSDCLAAGSTSRKSTSLASSTSLYFSSSPSKPARSTKNARLSTSLRNARSARGRSSRARYWAGWYPCGRGVSRLLWARCLRGK